jgi:hypothetical protein
LVDTDWYDSDIKINQTKMQINPLHKNNLSRYRKRIGIEKKKISFLLDNKSDDPLSRYEKGQHLPSLRTALMLEVIYRIPIRLLYYQLFEHCQREVAERLRQHPQLLPDLNQFPSRPEQLKHEEFCFYANLLKDQIPNELELQTVTKHVIHLSDTVSKYRQGINPFKTN